MNTYSLNWNSIGIRADSYESNNSRAAAKKLSTSGTISGLSLHNASDQDYFKINLTGTGTSSNYIKASFTHANGDVDMKLLNSAGTVVKSSRGTTNSENISLNGLAAGTYYLQVYGHNGAMNTYSLQWSTPTVVRGVMRKGTAAANTLTGTANCDIFYGAAGNDTIRGVNGRDVVVYDKNDWGKDTIAATSGTMSILFSGLKASDISATKSGSNMVFTRKGTSQKVTVQNWNAATHNIVYGGTLGEFSKYLKAASPTAQQQTLACNEVWKKVGLLA